METKRELTEYEMISKVVRESKDFKTYSEVKSLGNTLEFLSNGKELIEKDKEVYIKGKLSLLMSGIKLISLLNKELTHYYVVDDFCKTLFGCVREHIIDTTKKDLAEEMCDVGLLFVPIYTPLGDILDKIIPRCGKMDEWAKELMKKPVNEVKEELNLADVIANCTDVFVSLMVEPDFSKAKEVIDRILEENK